MIKIVEWFGGIGAFTQAIKRQNISHELVDYVELDKHAVNSFNAINDTNFIPTDINNVDVNKYGEIDILVAGWPCQDYSIAGNGIGLDGSRSSLILTTIAKIKEMTVKPKHILLENVKGLLSKKHIEDLAYIKELFINLGYEWDQALLNSKYFGVPQSRERVYMLLTRNDLPKKVINHLEQRNTVDKVLRDVLDFNEPTHTIELKENKGKVYFANQMSQYNGKIIELDIDKLNNQERDKINKVATLGTLENGELIPVSSFSKRKKYGADGQINTLTTRSDHDNQIMFKDHSFNQKKHFLGTNGISKTLRAGDCDAENKIIFKTISFNQDSHLQGINGQSTTMVASSPDFKNKVIYDENMVIHYRKLSTLECWRLMGFSDEAHNRVKALTKTLKNGKEKRLVSDSQLAKQAGNSIVVNVLEALIKQIKESE